MMTEEESIALWERSQARHKRDFTAIDYIGMIEYVDYVKAELTNTVRHVYFSDKPLSIDDMLSLFAKKLTALIFTIERDFAESIRTANKNSFDIEFKD